MTTAERNRTNANSSTGPRTEEGKAVSSKNALKTGLTGRTVLLPSDDAAAFEQHAQAYVDEYKPQGLRERELVQSLAETRWRLNRSFALEAALFSQSAADAEEGTPAPSNVENLINGEPHQVRKDLEESPPAGSAPESPLRKGHRRASGTAANPLARRDVKARWCWCRTERRPENGFEFSNAQRPPRSRRVHSSKGFKILPERKTSHESSFPKLSPERSDGSSGQAGNLQLPIGGGEPLQFVDQRRATSI